MKKEWSVLMLVVRSSINKILVVLVGMSVLQIGFFSFVVKRHALEKVILLEKIIEIGQIQPIFYIGFFLIGIILAWAEGRKGSQWEYTLWRLGISRERVFFLWSAYNIWCFFVLFAVEIFLVIGMGNFYLEGMDVTNRSSQSLFLAFWRNDFLHSLLPLSEGSRWIRNELFAVLLGLGITYFGGEEQWNRKLPLIWGFVLIVLMFSDSAGCWEADLGKSGVCLIGIVLLLAGEKNRYKKRVQENF